jgi:small subunit ribosomal protein S8
VSCLGSERLAGNMSTDLLSNMISSIKNAALVRKKSIEIPYSQACESVAKVLQKRGFLEGVKSFKYPDKSYKGLHLDLSFEDIGGKNECTIKSAKRMSKPGRRLYRKSTELPVIRGGMGTVVVSTSAGVMDSMEAKRRKLGGELVCEIF